MTAADGTPHGNCPRCGVIGCRVAREAAERCAADGCELPAEHTWGGMMRDYRATAVAVDVRFRLCNGHHDFLETQPGTARPLEAQPRIAWGYDPREPVQRIQ